MKVRFFVFAAVIALSTIATAVFAEVLLINRDSKDHEIIIGTELSGNRCYGKLTRYTLKANKTMKIEGGWSCIDNSGRPFLLRDGKRYEIKNGVAYPIWEN